MRLTGRLHGMLNRFSMCGLIWVPSPSGNRPRENSQIPADVGHRHRVAAKATAMLVPSSTFEVCSAASERQERVVTDLRGPAAVVAELLDLTRRAGPGQPGHDAAVDL